MNGASGADAPESADAHEDARLLARARAGDREAFESLYAAHVSSARRLATILTGPDASEDLVSEAFARILDLLRTGAGPTSNFRAYLHTTIRNRHRDQLRAAREWPASDQPWMLDKEEPPAEELVAGIDANGAVAALTSLPATWQRVLWHLEVEGRKPAEVAGLVAMTPAAVSSLAYRAREGLRRAYLDQHIARTSVALECRWTRARLSQYVRNDLSRRATAKVASHISDCAGCAGVYADLQTVNKKLAAYLFPVVLVGGMKALEAGGLAGLTPSGSADASIGQDGKQTQTGVPGSPAGQTGGFSLAGASAPMLSVVAVGIAAVAATAWAVSASQGTDNRPDRDAIVDVTKQSPTATETAPTAPPPTVETPAAPVGDGVPTPPAESVVTAPATPAPPPATDPPAPSPTTPPPAPGPSPSVDPDPPGPGDPDPAPEPITVRPVAPAAVPISQCGTYGSLTLPTTEGVRYRLTQGDGRAGPWQVDAVARRGFAFAEGARTSFSGDLGQFVACPVEVRPEAPVAIPIEGCGVYGSLSLPSTDGVVYELTVGDGRQGPWEVVASAVDGFVIAEGAQTRYLGDLGQYTPCAQPPAITGIDKVLAGSSPASDPWQISVATAVPDGAPRVLEVTYTFSTGVVIKSRSGAGWTCREPGGGEVGHGPEYQFPDPGIPFTCTFEYAGTTPPPVTLTVFGLDPNLHVVEPTGVVTLSSGGEVHGQQPF